jgi:hypothetical protein
MHTREGAEWYARAHLVPEGVRVARGGVGRVFGYGAEPRDIAEQGGRR